MDQTLTPDNPAQAALDNPTTEPTTPENGTGASDGQAPGATPDGDIFKGIDPSRLTPAERKTYDSMLRDYRDKTGKLSETIKSESAKAAEAFKSKAELYDQIAQQEEFVRQWNEYVEKVSKTGQGPADGDPVLSQMKQQIQEMNQKIQLTELSQVTEAFADAVDEKGEQLHPDFDQLNGFNLGKLQNGEDFSLLRAGVELAQGNSPHEKLANGYKAAKAVHDAIFESGKKAGMGVLNKKARNGTLPPTGSGAEPLSVTEQKPKNAREALALAKKGVMVSRD